MTVALYIDPRGPYPELLGAAACWDAARDARTYDGRDSVVAHPPCAPWSRLKHLYQGAEHDCAVIAVSQVRRTGGVLEHPAHSLLWGERFHGAPLPIPPDDPRHWGADRDRFGGYTIAVAQVDWGHVARKPTWLYLVGVPVERVRELVAKRPFPGRQPTHWASGSRTPSSRQGSPVPPGIKVCSAQQRRRTPPAFAEFLIALAESVSGGT